VWVSGRAKSVCKVFQVWIMMACHQRCLEQDMLQQLPSAAKCAPAAQGMGVFARMMTGLAAEAPDNKTISIDATYLDLRP
jgi:hypothetical protein